MFFVKISLFIFLFITIYTLLAYVLLFLWCKSSNIKTNNDNDLNHEIINEKDDLKLSLVDGLIFEDNQALICDNSIIPDELCEYEKIDHYDQSSNVRRRKKNYKLENNYDKLVKIPHINPVLVPESIENNHLGDLLWISFILLNIGILLDCFWIRFRSIRLLIRNFFTTFVDLNCAYASLVMVFQSSYSSSLIENYHQKFYFLLPQKKIHSFIENLFLNQSFLYERFSLSFCFTGAILVFIRFKLFPNDSIDEGTENSETISNSRLFQWFSHLFCFLGVVLFRKTRRYRRRNFSTIFVDNFPRIGVNDEEAEETEFSDIDSGEDDDSVFMDENFDFDPMERILIERLFAVPNLWLHTELISNDYLEKLPVWNYQKVMVDCNQNLMMTMSESSSSQSSSSSDEEYMDSKDEIEENENMGISPSVSCSCYRRSIPLLNQANIEEIVESESPKRSPKKLIEIVPEMIHSSITSSIRKKIEKKRRNIIRKKSSRLKLIEESKPKHQDNQQQQQPSQRPEWMIDLHECTVCLDHYENDQPIMGLPCGHNYHHHCIGEWLTRGNHCCPICRWPSYRLRHPRQQQQHPKKFIIS